MKVAIVCPSCSKEYRVSDQHIGKKVTCANKACGTTFIAKERNDELDAEADENDFVDFADFVQDDARPVMPPAKKKPTSEEEEPMEQFRIAPCMFRNVGRFQVYCGLALLGLGAMLPYMKMEIRLNAGDPSEFFNLPMAARKLTVLLAGMTLTIAGSAMWSGSRKGPGDLDTALLVLGTLGVVAATIYRAAIL